MTTRARWSAWGTHVHLLTRRAADLPPLRELAEAVLVEVGAACSRFDPDSDLSRVNVRPGEWVQVDPLLVAAVRVALLAAAETEGLVNPLLGRPLVALGYDSDLATLRDLGPVADIPVPAPDAWRSIQWREDSLRIPAGTALDLGSVTKAWTADLIAAAHAGEHGTPALINLGGDLSIAAPDGEPWEVDIAAHPTGPVQTRVAISAGGLASSSTVVRRWRRGGVVRHHLLDPRTNHSAPEVWTLATVAAPSATAANTAATAAVVLGEEAPGWLMARGADARLYGPQGVVTTGSWPAETRWSA